MFLVQEMNTSTLFLEKKKLSEFEQNFFEVSIQMLLLNILTLFMSTSRMFNSAIFVSISLTKHCWKSMVMILIWIMMI